MQEPQLSQDDDQLLEAAIQRRQAPEFQAVNEEKLAQDQTLTLFTVKLPAADIYALKAEARKRNLSAGELLRRFVRDGLSTIASQDLDDPSGRAAFLQALGEELDTLRQWTMRSSSHPQPPARTKRGLRSGRR